MSAFMIFVLVVFMFAVIVASMSVKSVPQGYEFTVERFGKYTYTLMPGLNIIMPLMDMVARKVIMMEQTLDVAPQKTISSDNVTLTVDGVIFFQIFDAAKASYEIHNLKEALLNLVMTNFRTIVGSMALDALLSSRDDINVKLLGIINEAAAPWGVRAIRIEIKDMSPPVDLLEAMGRQMKAERLKRASILEAEGLKQSEILRAEGVAASTILQAEGASKSAILQAEGAARSAVLKAEGEKQSTVLEAEGRLESSARDGEAREILAKAEANAVTAVSQAIAAGDIQAINYFVAQKYVDSIKEIASSNNSKLILMPLEASSVIGSLAGITKLVKSSGLTSK